MMRSVTVLGGGESGVGAALLAQKKGLEVFVSDYGEIEEKYRKELEYHNIPFEEKGHTLDKIETTNVIVKSPGIPDKAPVIQYFRLRQKRIISEIEFASKFYDGNIIAITGSNGKTTTTSLTYHLLSQSDKRIGLGGNIGTSFARLLLEEHRYDWVVLELSSFQLDDIDSFESDISSILNITPDHLDRYDYDFKKYGQAKWRLAESTKNHLILNQDDDLLKRFAVKNPPKAEMHWLSSIKPNALLSKDSKEVFEINLKGRHNTFNASVAIKIARLFGLNDAKIKARLKSFQAIEHRLETVAKINGIEFINDSKATNIDAVKYALEAMDVPVVWIAGGTDKGNEYDSILPLVKSKVKSLVCLCKDDSKLRSAFENDISDIISKHSMQEAVSIAFERAERGDVVLLSPACASFDLFKNYAHRGEEFKKSVFNLLSGSN